MAGGLMLALTYQFAVIGPLARANRNLDQRLADTARILSEAGYGATAEELAAHVDRIREDIDNFSRIGRGDAIQLRIPEELAPMIKRPFRLIDFDQRKFFVIDHLAELADGHSVELFGALEDQLPEYVPGMDDPQLLWAELVVFDQLARAAVHAGVGSIDDLRVLPHGRTAPPGRNLRQIPARMAVTGPLPAVQALLMMLPLTAEELDDLGLPDPGDKSPFYLSRFLMVKSSKENAAEVSLELVVTGVLEFNPPLD